MLCYLVQAEDIIQKYFRGRSNLRFIRIHFEYFQEKTLHIEGNATPKANLKFTYRFTQLVNLDSVRMMSRTNIDGATPFSCKQNNALLCL